MEFLSWVDLPSHPTPAKLFLVKPFVPAGGVVLLHGKKSLGKSPLGWHLARCVGEGRDFFGYPTNQGNVLYLEADTPKIIAIERVRAMAPAPNVTFAYTPACNVLGDIDVTRELREAHAKYVPDLVIVNTLRRVHTAEDVPSHIASRVYSTFQRIFPHAALLFVHHNRKTYRGLDGNAPTDEDFAGSQAWANDAQVVLHLGLVKRHPDKSLVIRLEHTYSQASELADPLTLHLANDGATLTRWADEQTDRMKAFAAQLPPSLTPSQRMKAVAAEFKKPELEVWRALLE